jgi:uncharacterized membrane protein
MADIESYLTRWQSAGIINPDIAVRIRTNEAEQEKPTGIRWYGIVALVLGAVLLACGVVLFVNAHWDQMGPSTRFVLVLAMVSIFHIGGAIARANFRALSTTLHAVGTISSGAAIALVGQIFNIEEHWPAAILMWAVAALAGWLLLRDEAQQTLTLLLFPAWILSEISYAAQSYVGESAYIGRFLIVWAMLYLTIFLDSQRKVLQGTTFTAAAIAALVGTIITLDGWRSWWGMQGFLPLHQRIWDWLAIAALPLLISLFRRRESFIPVATALIFGLILPWSTRNIAENFNGRQYSRYEPNLAAHALVAAFAIFIIWWGVRQMSRALVNLGILGFAIAVGWFYFSDIFDKIGRSLGLIGLGILFLAGGWALEKTRRRLITHMQKPTEALGEAQ